MYPSTTGWRRRWEESVTLEGNAGLMRTPKAAQSFLRFPTSRLLATPASVRVLRELSGSDDPLAVTALAERTGLSAQAVRNVLADLQQGGVVEGLGAGRSRLYRADVGHPLYVPLASLFRAEADRYDTITAALETAAASLTPAPLGAWIYGSVARGDDGPEADVEVAVVAADQDVDTTVDRLREMVAPLQDIQRAWIAVIGLSPADVRRLSKGDRWWKSLVRAHVTLFGEGPEALAESLRRPSRRGGAFGT